MTDYPRPTVQELEARLADMRQRNAETHARRMAEQTDLSDCALSCWAEQSNEAKLLAMLDLARNGYMADFPALFHLDGTPVEGAKQVTFKDRYSFQMVTKWVINHPNGQTEWLPFTSPSAMTARKAKNLAERGYKVGTVSKPAHIVSQAGNYIGAPVHYYPAAD